MRQHMAGIHDATFRITSHLLRGSLILPNQSVLFFPLPQHHTCESSWVGTSSLNS